jgi:hypothetical protein
MVRTLAWGPLDAPVNPSVQPQPPCTFTSAAASSEAVSIFQACPNNPDVKLTMLKVSKEDVTPEQRYAQQLGVPVNSGAKVLLVAGSRTAAYLPTPQPRIVVFDETGAQASSTLLSKPALPSLVASRTGSLATIWTGDSVVVLDASSLTPRYTIVAGAATPLGPGVVMANRLLIPVTTGMAVYDPANGAPDRVIPVTRPPGEKGPVVPAVAGSTLLEQRGDTLVALGQKS